MSYETQCPKCGALQADSLLCKTCSDKLVAQLRELPDLFRELHITLTRQARMGSGGAGGKGKGKERPLPFNTHASEVKDDGWETLAAWVKRLDWGDTKWTEELCTCRPYAACTGLVEVTLTKHPTDYANWLADKIERIRGHEDAGQIADEIEYLTKQIRAAIDRPADLEFHGKCTVCEADLYAPQGSVEGQCRKCKIEGVTTTYDPAANRAEIESQAEHHWGTVAECARVLSAFGLEVEVKTIRNWASKNRHGNIQLQQRGANALGHALYRIGDVMDLCREKVEQGKKRRGRAA